MCQELWNTCVLGMCPRVPGPGRIRGRASGGYPVMSFSVGPAVTVRRWFVVNSSPSMV